jgi:hypothetical protein
LSDNSSDGEKKSMSKIENLFIKYNVELLIIGFSLGISALNKVFSVEYDYFFKIFTLLIGAFISIPIIRVAFSKNLSGTRNAFIFMLLFFSPLTLLGEIYIKRSDISDIIETILALMFLDIVVYYSYLDIKFQSRTTEEMKSLNRIEYLVLKYNIRFIILGLLGVMSVFEVLNSEYYFFKIFIVLIITFISAQMIYVAISQSLSGSRNVCIFSLVIFSPLILLREIYMQRNILDILEIVLELIFFSVTVYHSYLNIKFEATRKEKDRKFNPICKTTNKKDNNPHICSQV